jgi:hypothetical protein
MGNVDSFLVDWSIRFLENNDSIKKEIVKIQKDKERSGFTIDYKDKMKYFIVVPILDTSVFDKIDDGKYFGIIALNTPANIRLVVSEWKKLADFKSLSIYFVNPFSCSDKVWVINPYIHDKICDKASLESGLKSMAEMVEGIGIEELNKKIKLLKGESGQ